jgi:hypothetical protein
MFTKAHHLSGESPMTTSMAYCSVDWAGKKKQLP